MLLPPRLNDEASAIVRPIRDRPITDLSDLLKRIRRLEACDARVTVYPDAEEYIHTRLLQQRIATTVAEIRRNPKAHPFRTGLLKVEILPYQLDGIAFAAGAGRAILADDMGLGKTLQGIGVAELLAREANIRKVLVVCPASVKAQWRSEVVRFSERNCQIVLGNAAERAAQYDNDCFFTICNYEQVLRDILAIERAKWDLIVLDEGQRIKNWEAKTTQTMKSLRSPFALVLSGTPLENRLDDLFSVVEFIDDRRLGPAFRFFNCHRVTDEKGKVLGYKDLDTLRERLKPILLRRTRSAVMKDLPPRTTEIVRIAPTDEQACIDLAQMQIVSSIVRKAYISEMDLLRLQKALLLARMNADSTYLVDKQPPGFSSKLERLEELLDGASRGGGTQDRALLRVDDDAHLDRAADQATQARLRQARWIGSAKEASTAGESVSARSGMPGVSHHQRGLDRAQPAGGKYRHQCGSPVESCGSRTAHRAGSSHGAEESGAGLSARDGGHNRGEAARDPLGEA